MSINEKQLQEMLQIALENWDFEDAFPDREEEAKELRETIEGMIGVDLSEDFDEGEGLAEIYIKDNEDWGGLGSYLDVIIESGRNNRYK